MPSPVSSSSTRTPSGCSRATRSWTRSRRTGAAATAGECVSDPSHAERVLALALGREPTLGAGRLICVDGPAGSGKTTLAADLAALSGALVVHLDDMYEGWGGLLRAADRVDSLLLPLARGEPGSYRRWDWHAGDWAETVSVPPVPLLVLEGVGSG